MFSEDMSHLLEDITAVLLAAKQDERDLILTIYGTGARISEVCRLTWEDVNLSSGAITLWTRKRKGGGLQPNAIMMTEKLKDVMQRRWNIRNKQSQFVFCKPDGTSYTKDSYFVRMMISKLCKRAGVKSFGYHSIRHKVASILMDSGKATLSNIQHFLRHNRPTTRENYLKSLNPGCQEMADTLDDYQAGQLDEVKSKEPQSSSN